MAWLSIHISLYLSPHNHKHPSTYSHCSFKSSLLPFPCRYWFDCVEVLNLTVVSGRPGAKTKFKPSSKSLPASKESFLVTLDITNTRYPMNAGSIPSQIHLQWLKNQRAHQPHGFAPARARHTLFTQTNLTHFHPFFIGKQSRFLPSSTWSLPGILYLWYSI